MSKRLQVVVKEADLERYEHSAQAAGLTLSAWARQALDAAERQYSNGSVERKLAAIRMAVASDILPAVDVDTMLAENEERYTDEALGLDYS
jgi:hypothetical protein